MEYADDAFHTFLDLDSAIYLAVNGTVISLPVFIQNIFMVLERHMASEKRQDFHFGVEHPFKAFM